MNMENILHAVHSASDLNILLFYTLFYTITGLGFYHLLKLIFRGRRLWHDSYYGVTIIGTTLSLNAVLLTFTLIQCISSSQEISQYVSRELQSLYSLETEMLPLSSKSLKQIKPFLDDYMTSVIMNEWPLMDGNERDKITEKKFHSLINAARTFKVNDSNEEIMKKRIEDAIPDVIKHRYYRIKTRGKNISQTFFVLIYFLEFLYVLQFFLLTRQTRLSEAILSIHLAMLGGLLALIVLYDHPYEGETSNSAKEFLPMIERLREMNGATIPGDPTQSADEK